LLTSKERKPLRFTSSQPGPRGFLLILFLVVCQLTCAQIAFAQKQGAEKKPVVSGEKKAEKVTIQFVDVELAAITKFISEITGKNFIFDDRLRGTISILAPSKLSVDEAFNLFTAVLELKEIGRAHV
jgi:type II secretory pathway component GspD/PulD (secretin)